MGKIYDVIHRIGLDNAVINCEIENSLIDSDFNFSDPINIKLINGILGYNYCRYDQSSNAGNTQKNSEYSGVKFTRNCEALEPMDLSNPE